MRIQKRHTSKTLQSQSKQTIKKNTKQNGELISMVKIDVKQAYNDLQSYRMTYWCARVKVVAYVPLPTIVGPYPMFLHTQGGYALPDPYLVHIDHEVKQGRVVDLNATWLFKIVRVGGSLSYPCFEAMKKVMERFRD